jgi:hypothetical protein
VVEEPVIILRPWLVLQCADGTRFVLGYNAAAFEGRMSTALVDQDFELKTVRTASGRLYRLEGAPALDADAEYVFFQRAPNLRLTDLKDVSDNFWAGHRPGEYRRVDSRLEVLRQSLLKQGDAR